MSQSPRSHSGTYNTAAGSTREQMKKITFQLTLAFDDTYEKRNKRKAH